jgi:small subunit ribosomal protein S4
LARDRDSACKKCRNEGQKLFLKGSRCDTPKCAFERRPYKSGPHGQGRPVKKSEYAIQLREKQKVRRTYAVSEKQFKKYYDVAAHHTGVTGTLLFQILESRLDNVIYRSGLVPSRAQARQMIGHGHFLVDGKKVDIPSFQVKPGQLVTVKEKSKSLIKSLTEHQSSLPPAPRWMEMDKDALAIKVMARVEREDVDANIKEALIVEYYSR